MAEVGDKIVMTVKEVYRHSSGKTFYIMEGCKRWVFTDDDLEDFERLPFSPEDLTLGSFVDDPDEGIIQRYLEFAKETGRDFHLTITAEGETSIDLTVPTKTVTESKYYSIPGVDEDAGCDTCDWDQEVTHEHCKKCTRNFADEYKKRV